MTEETKSRELTEILVDLIEIPLSYKEQSETALKRVTQLGQEALGSHACTLVFLDLESKLLTQEACASVNHEFEDFVSGKQNKFDNFMDYGLLAQGEPIERYDLQNSGGGGVANPAVAQRYGLQSAYCHPLKSGENLIGYFNHFAATSDVFTEEKKNQIRIFASQAANVIEKFQEYKAVNVLDDLSQDLLSLTPDRLLQQIPMRACELLSVPICIVWKLNESREKLGIVAATDNVDEEYRKISLNAKSHGVEQLLTGRAAKYLPDVRNSPLYEHPEHAQARGWVSLLSVPMQAQDETLGLLEVYTYASHKFEEREKKHFVSFANYVALSMQKGKAEQALSSLRVVSQAFEKMATIRGESGIDDILKLTLKSSLRLIGQDNGAIGKLDYKTGKLEFVDSSRNLEGRALTLGEGITGKALLEGKTLNIEDVHSDEWKDTYVAFWPDTQSELAIPLLINNAKIREGFEIKFGTRAIGVLNIESPMVGAFSQTDEEALLPLVSQAALLIERSGVDRRLTELRIIERKISDQRDWKDVLKVVAEGIINTLGFEVVNISLVDAEQNSIKTEYVAGIPPEQAEVFKKKASHTLDSKDIQANIVRSKKIEVPDVNDPRFDEEIFQEFGHQNLIRVFLPMIVSTTGKVIGTVEAGYKRDYRKHIYERDVQILQGFVDFAVEAVEQRRSGQLDKLSHELRAPLVGIRSHASFIRRRRHELPASLVDTKLEDIQLDCDIFLHQIEELEYVLGRTPPSSEAERTSVMRDIVFKTANQLKPLIADQGFSLDKITYDVNDANRVIVYLDKAKLNQVVYNLLINSIRYAEKDTSQFTIRINLDDTRGNFHDVKRKENFIVKFKDWGIGVKKGLEEKIFDDSFRTPEAIARNPVGSGLGLTIARKIMREFGGDLILANNSKPTEFHMIIPKKLKESPT